MGRGFHPFPLTVRSLLRFLSQHSESRVALFPKADVDGFFLVPLDGLTTIRTPIVPALDVTSHRFGSAGTTQNRTALKTIHPRRADLPPIGQSLSLPRKCDDVSNPRIAFVPFASPQGSRSINNTAYSRSDLRGTWPSSILSTHAHPPGSHSRILSSDMTTLRYPNSGQLFSLFKCLTPFFFSRVAGPRLSARRLPRLRSFQPSEGPTVRSMFCSVQHDRPSHVL